MGKVEAKSFHRYSMPSTSTPPFSFCISVWCRSFKEIDIHSLTKLQDILMSDQEFTTQEWEERVTNWALSLCIHCCGAKCNSVLTTYLLSNISYFQKLCDELATTMPTNMSKPNLKHLEESHYFVFDPNWTWSSTILSRNAPSRYTTTASLGT